MQNVKCQDLTPCSDSQAYSYGKVAESNSAIRNE